jgi:hypothetical protein
VRAAQIAASGRNEPRSKPSCAVLSLTISLASLKITNYSIRRRQVALLNHQSLTMDPAH